MGENNLIPNLFRTEFSKITAVLCKAFGLSNIQLAEDIASDAFLIAAETWGLKGVPENPKAWLYTVAKNKAKDYLKRDKLFLEKISPELKRASESSFEFDFDLSPDHINDSQLQMMFAICSPVIRVESQIGLSLRILCGFGIEEIAEAFLTNKETINKRLYRAKEKIKKHHIKMEIPRPSEIKKRLETVLGTIYLLFNEGYYSSTQNTSLRKDLCFEAMRLNHILIENKSTNQPMANALMALMCFHSSRFDARTNKHGDSILYDKQDRTLWDEELILKGNQYLIKSAKGQEISKYHLEASIAYWHCTKTGGKNKWENILQLYNKLLQIEYSPVAALNRTYALAMANGKEEAIKEAEKIDLKNNYLYHSLLAELYKSVHREKEIYHLREAINLVKNEGEKKLLLERLGHPD